MDVGPILAGSGACLGCLMAGAGALKMFLVGSHAIERIPMALEGIAEASKRQAAVMEQSAAVGRTLYELRDGQDQIRTTMGTIVLRLEELPCISGVIQPPKCEGK